MKTVVFYLPYIGAGGTETLVMRLSQWSLSNGNRVVVLSRDPTTFKNVFNNLECYIYNNKKKTFITNDSHIELTFLPSETVSVISFSLIDFLRCNDLLNKRYNCCFAHKLYIVHPNWSFFSKYTKWLNPLMVLLVKTKTIVFMDEETRDTCINRYKMKKYKTNIEILHIPMIIKNNILSKPKNQIINILTISRFDFPFKAYILGLIDIFGALANTHKELSLTIIGGGKRGSVKELELVNKKINGLSKEIQEKIFLKGTIPYTELDAHIEGCDIFVGMGTTILDAANMNKICLVATSYQDGDLSLGFFYDNYKILGGIYDEKMTYFHLYDLIQQVISFDDKTFIERADITKKLLVENYDINKIAPKLISSNIFSFGERLELFAYRKMVSFYDFIRSRKNFKIIL